MSQLFTRSTAAAFVLSLLAGCSVSSPHNVQAQPQVRQLTQSAHCGLTGPGVAPVNSSRELDKLLGVSGQNMATGVIRQVDLAHEQLIIITLGQRPTAGYSVGLRDVQWEKPTLKLEMRVGEPAPDMMVAQVLTSPCVVLGVRGGPWERLEVTGLTATPIVKTSGK
ncbi:MAG TPA: protease complex subunit PrcB family protein [Marinobacter sp.]|nr:protease complex subunit PrcB family protein [Marinobacter sp.]